MIRNECVLVDSIMLDVYIRLNEVIVLYLIPHALCEFDIWGDIRKEC